MLESISFETWSSQKLKQENAAADWMKIVIDEKYGEILGAHAAD